MLHYTGMADEDAALDWLCHPEAVVSSHYVVREGGGVVQLVDEGLRAHHAGAGSWRGDDDMNSRSVGIEICNPGHQGAEDRSPPPFADGQINAVISLVLDIRDRNGIESWNVIGHSDYAPGRKIDPGEAFPWRRLGEAGAALFVEAAPLRAGTFFQEGDEGEPVRALQTLLRAVGYGVDPHGRFDERTRVVVKAFQQRHRPSRVDGIADPSTVETLRDWARSLPSEALLLS